ncbi:hypothetical protein BASA83_004437 [Batrachochytrium salamandrivorans]|nr:hypothetical protein BASA83_004437 [Batrachochytrium salamandrivorans]
MLPFELTAYLMAHPDLFFADTLRLLWQTIGTLLMLIQEQVPRLVSYILSATPPQILVLLGICFAGYFILLIIVTLMKSVMRFIVLMVKLAVFCCVVALVLYVAQAYLLSSPGYSAPSGHFGVSSLWRSFGQMVLSDPGKGF